MGRTSLKVLKVEVKVIFGVFLAICLLKLCLKLIASEDKFKEKKCVLGIKNIGPQPLRGGGCGAPGSASDNFKSLNVIQVYSCVVTNDKTDADRLTVLISNLTITFKDDMLTF